MPYRLPKEIKIGVLNGSNNDFDRAVMKGKKNVPVSLDIKSSGNIFLSASEDELSGNDLNNFLLSHIFNCFNAFPLGSLKIHLITNSPEIEYYHLQNELNDSCSSDLFCIYDNFDILDDFKNIICKDTIRKFTSKCNDFYALRAVDTTEKMNLIIVKGLNGAACYDLERSLDTLECLSGQYGHKCGIRFLILEDKSNNEHDTYTKQLGRCYYNRKIAN